MTNAKKFGKLLATACAVGAVSFFAVSVAMALGEAADRIEALEKNLSDLQEELM